jgi:accessory colonization factor AcfC
MRQGRWHCRLQPEPSHLVNFMNPVSLRSHLVRLLGGGAIALLAASGALAQTLHMYGPGGPAPAMKEAAAAFERAGGAKIEVVAGPTPQWLPQAKSDADLVYSGSETMMTDFVVALEPQLSHREVTPLYLRPLAMLVRPGNPRRIRSFEDLLRPGTSILVVNGAGQNGAWEDAAGRKGDIRTVKALRANIAAYARNSAEAKATWTADPSIDVWLIWNIWQVASPALADVVEIAPDYAIYRDTGVAITSRGKDKAQAQKFVEFLQSPAGAAIFARWGWKTN